MIKHIRLYKPHDIDLMAIQQAGFPLSTLFAIAIRSYANKNPVHIIFQDIQQYESFYKKNIKEYSPQSAEAGDNHHFIRVMYNIPDSDIQTINFLKSVRKGYIGIVSKMILRKALQGNICGFLYENSSWFDHDKFISNIELTNSENILTLTQEMGNTWRTAKWKKLLNESGFSLNYSETKDSVEKNKEHYSVQKKDSNLLHNKSVQSLSRTNSSIMNQKSPEKAEDPKRPTLKNTSHVDITDTPSINDESSQAVQSSQNINSKSSIENITESIDRKNENPPYNNSRSDYNIDVKEDAIDDKTSKDDENDSDILNLMLGLMDR